MSSAFGVKPWLVTAIVGVLAWTVSAFGQINDVARSWTQAAEESFWYSFYTVESTLLTSGLGVPLAPKEDALFSDLSPVQAPYRSGNPRFAQAPLPNQPNSLRWITQATDQTLSLETLAYAVLAEFAWMQRFDQLQRQQPAALDTFKAQALRFERLASGALAFAQQNLATPDGRYWDELTPWGNVPVTRTAETLHGQLAWLWALAALAGDPQQRFADRVPGQLALSQFQRLDRASPWKTLGLSETSLAIKALAQLAVALPPGNDRTRALDLLSELTHQLALAQATSVAEQAARISGLGFAYHLLGDAAAGADLVEAWQTLKSWWNAPLGLFILPGVGRAEFSVETWAQLASAMQALIYAGDDATEAQGYYVTAFQTLKASGLQRAEGPEAGGAFDGDPVPDFTQTGEAPVLAGLARFQDGAWQIVDGFFRTAPALSAATSMLWLSVFQQAPFEGPPPAGLPTDPQLRQADLPQQFGTLSRGLLQTQQAVEALAHQVAALETEFQQLNRGGDAALRQQWTADLAAVRDDLQQRLQGLSQQLGQPDALATVQAQVDDALNSHTTQLQQTVTQISKLDQRVNAVFDLIQIWQNQSTELQQRLDGLGDEVQAELTQWENRLRLDQRDQTLRDQIQVLAKQLETQLNNQLAPLTQTIDRLDGQLDQLDRLPQQMGELQTKLGQMDTRLAQLENVENPLDALFQPQTLLWAVLGSGAILILVGVLRRPRPNAPPSASA